MSENVINIHGGEPPISAGIPQPALISFLEELLAHARSGFVQHVAAVWIDKTGFVGDGHAPGCNNYDLIPLIGGLEVCKHTLLSLAKFDEDVE